MSALAYTAESSEGVVSSDIDTFDVSKESLGCWNRAEGSGEEEHSPNEEQSPSDFVEVFVGGLPSDVTQEEVTEVFSKVGEVLSVRLNRRKKTGECKGFGFVRYKDQLTAEVACRDIMEVNGKQVGVHISRPREVESDASILLAGLDSEGGINKLLKLIYAHPDRKAAVAAAIKAVMAQTSRRNGHRASSGENEDLGLDDPSLPDPSTFLQNFTRCKQLVERFRENPNTSNKTPLAILHEYATRLNLELKYENNADSNLGPFTTGAKLMSPGGAVKYAAGEGRGRSKKEAKQVTAAAVLEDLLNRVPMDNFLQTAKKTVVRGPPLSGIRPQMGLRGRGRGRSSNQFGRGSLDSYLPANFAAFSAAPAAQFDLSLAPSAASMPQPQNLLQNQDTLHSLDSLQHAQQLRSYLASQTADADLYARMRGQSLDSITSNIQRHFVANNALNADMSIYGNSRSFDNSGFTAGMPPQDQQQEFLQRQRQAQQYPQQIASMADPTFANLAQGNSNLFSSQAYHSPTHLPFQQY